MAIPIFVRLGYCGLTVQTSRLCACDSPKLFNEVTCVQNGASAGL